MAIYIVTGGTGFLGRRVVQDLLDYDPEAIIHVLIRESSQAKLAELVASWRGGTQVHSMIGDLTADGLGLTGSAPRADHVVHVGAVYDMTVDEDTAYAANVTGTRSVLALAADLGAVLHHVSSVVVAGDHKGKFFEEDFDLGQRLTSPYHRTTFAAEKLVRQSRGVRWRVYRPAIIVGDSRTGEMDKIDGPYFFFAAIAKLAALPSNLPVPLPDLGATNIVPVDYVSAAMVELICRPGLNGRTFHLVNPQPQPFGDVYRALAAAAGAPLGAGTLPGSRLALNGLAQLPGVPAIRDAVVEQLGIPAEVAQHISFSAEFISDTTRALLRGTHSTVPRFDSYAARLWHYWRDHLDPRRRCGSGSDDPLAGRIVLITGASSGIGLATAHAAANRGATVLMVARGHDDLTAAMAAIRAEGHTAHAYPCDVTDSSAVEELVRRVLDDHGHVDYLVNNAGRSIRRSVLNSTDRMHDFERTMAVNYFGAVRLILGLLPSMRARRFGHVINISSIAVQTKVPRFSAYVASKSALDNFSDIAAVENRDVGITFTSVRMPLVRTPMIASTDLYRSLPVPAPEHAAALVLRAMEDRPHRIDTPVGTLAQAVEALMPSVKRQIMHQGFRLFGESRAAHRNRTAAQSGVTTATAAPDHSALSVLAPVIIPLMAMPGPAARIARVVPGLQW
ncbi:SDR family oxidoreductase [Nocardia sp. CNY236]|uniref:SDR family oxidoreductase n=1 Tax=Nocardia sp. CNY236 TaxID=1169152 RepID=UPI0003FE2935|nr:SDR family oxidoreductase [Nocardia sp. CNY236]